MRSVHQYYNVEILSARASEFTLDGFRYVSLPSQSMYSIRLSNNGETRCDVDVSIDDQLVGTWRVNAHSSITIDRPVHTDRVFTFVSETSSIARRTGAIIGSQSNGLIHVVFKPAKREVWTQMSSFAPTSSQSVELARRKTAPGRACSSQDGRPSSSLVAPNYESGATVLGRRSMQEFTSTASLSRDEIDWSNITEINIRLVAEREYEPEYVSLSGSRVPPRIDYGGRRAQRDSGRVD